jgi:hypothetical protein
MGAGAYYTCAAWQVIFRHRVSLMFYQNCNMEEKAYALLCCYICLHATGSASALPHGSNITMPASISLLPNTLT